MQSNVNKHNIQNSLIRTLLLQSFVTAQKIIKKSTLVNNTSSTVVVVTHEILSSETNTEKKNNIFKRNALSKLRISNESTFFKHLYFKKWNVEALFNINTNGRHLKHFLLQG